MAAAFLCSHAGIESRIIDNSASYISNWWSRLSEDRRLLIHSATGAQKAADYIVGDTAVSPDPTKQRVPFSLPPTRGAEPRCGPPTPTATGSSSVRRSGTPASGRRWS